MKIILVNGMPESGKTTFEEMCAHFYRESNNFRNYIITLSTITPIKKLAEQIGWDGKKTPKDRKFLSNLKDLCTEYNDYSINWIKEGINNYCSSVSDYEVKKTFVFIDTREPEEIERLKKEWNAKALLMRRTSVENNEQSNHADAEVFKSDYDYIIENNGAKEDLKEKAKEFIIKLENEEWESRVK